MGSLISQPEEDESDYDEDSYDDWQSPEQSPVSISSRIALNLPL